MKVERNAWAGVFSLACATSLLFLPATASAQDAAELRQRIAQLEAELAEAKSELAEASSEADEATQRAEAAETKLGNVADAGPSKIELQGPFGGTLKIGGAIRANYTLGDYTDPNGSIDGTRGDTGTISLDIFRVNMDYANGNFVGKLEYRFYPGYRTSNQDSYHMPHTAWLGYNLENGQVQVGINRVPFGPGAYGISQSWFFDQHYYLGLADDMDFGIKYSTSFGDMKMDFAYYYSDEGSWTGEYFSSDSVRYSYDVVNESGSGYEERNQVNFRLRTPVQLGENISSEIGVSLQYGELDSNGPQDDGSHYAISGHAVTSISNWKLALQATLFSHDVEADQPMGTDELVQFGAFDFATLAPADGWIAGGSLSYYLQTDGVNWLDYLIPYIEYSSIFKDESGFNDSELFVIGTAWGRGGWYIYSEFAWSNGNDFVGNESGYGDPAPAELNGRFASNRFGANPNADWEMRFNINFGYYF